MPLRDCGGQYELRIGGARDRSASASFRCNAHHSRCSANEMGATHRPKTMNALIPITDLTEREEAVMKVSAMILAAVPGVATATALVQSDSTR